MKTNTFNYFRNAFAIVGFFIIACSVGTADDTTVEPEPPVQSNIGKYQVSFSNTNFDTRSIVLHMVVLNTETGVSKTYSKGNGNDPWLEITPAAITFNH
jgi:hypothetical protein